MATPALTTRLDAVNVVLSASGENPISALTNSTADAANADSIIEEVSRTVQSDGYHFNTEKDFILTPDTEHFINLPANVLDIDADATPGVDVVQRGNRLYDKITHSYIFLKPVTAEIVFMLPFEELPEHARYFIAVKAARTFHDRYVGSEVEHKFTQDDENAARMKLNASNTANSDNNIFRSNPAFARQLSRR